MLTNEQLTAQIEAEAVINLIRDPDDGEDYLQISDEDYEKALAIIGEGLAILMKHCAAPKEDQTFECTCYLKKGKGVVELGVLSPLRALMPGEQPVTQRDRLRRQPVGRQSK